MINHKYIFCLLVLGILIVAKPQTIGAQRSQDTLNQYVAELQKRPDDNSLRERIIIIAQRIKPFPIVPEDAERYMVRGETAIDLAKESKNYNDAIAEFEKAVLSAPWNGSAYFNLAVALELSGDFNAAIKNYKFYLLAEPDASDAKEVKAKTYALEFKQENADKKEKEATDLIRNLVGIWAMGESSETDLDNGPWQLRGMNRFEFELRLIDKEDFELFGYRDVISDNGNLVYERDQKLYYKFTGRITDTKIKGKILCYGYNYCIDREYPLEGEVQQGGRNLMFKWFQVYRYASCEGCDPCPIVNQTSIIHFYRK